MAKRSPPDAGTDQKKFRRGLTRALRKAMTLVPAPPQFAQGWRSANQRCSAGSDYRSAGNESTGRGRESLASFVYVKLPVQGAWVSAAQVVPGNRGVVHHVLVTTATLPPDAEIDADGRMKLGSSPQTQGRQNGEPRARTANPVDSGFSAGWEPGVDAAVTYGPGVAEHLTGTHLLFNLHYQPNGHATTDRTRLALWFQKGPVTAANAGTGTGLGGGSETFIVNGQELEGRYTAQVTLDVPPPGTKTVPNIPAGSDNYRLTAVLPIRQDMVLYSIQPHMHLRGKAMKYTAFYPDGREEELLNVPHYDFNWQIIYEYAKPVKLPAGTTIHVEARWDNSVNNKYNPKPDQDVYWGEQSWDEMFSPILRAVVQLKETIMPTAPQAVAMTVPVAAR